MNGITNPLEVASWHAKGKGSCCKLELGFRSRVTHLYLLRTGSLCTVCTCERIKVRQCSLYFPYRLKAKANSCLESAWLESLQNPHDLAQNSRITFSKKYDLHRSSHLQHRFVLSWQSEIKTSHSVLHSLVLMNFSSSNSYEALLMGLLQKSFLYEMRKEHTWIIGCWARDGGWGKRRWRPWRPIARLGPSAACLRTLVHFIDLRQIDSTEIHCVADHLQFDEFTAGKDLTNVFILR